MEGIHDGQYPRGAGMEHFNVGANLFLLVLPNRVLSQCRAYKRRHRTKRHHVPARFTVHDVYFDFQLDDDCRN